MGPMPKELVSYEVSFEQVIFRCIIGISLQHEVWVIVIEQISTLDCICEMA
jgi:hypothetical protein